MGKIKVKRNFMLRNIVIKKNCDYCGNEIITCSNCHEEFNNKVVFCYNKVVFCCIKRVCHLCSKCYHNLEEVIFY